MKIFNTNSFNFKKASIMIFILNILQVSISVTILFFYSEKNKRPVQSLDILIFMVVISVIINSFVILYDKYSIKKVNSQYNLIKETLTQVENLNNTLRAQRHDFLNHLQVVYSLIEMDEHIEAKEYIEKVFTDIQKVSRFLKTSKPAINALLQAKIIYCEKRKIEVNLSVTTSLNGLCIHEWEVCRVLGNLIDNSIYVLKDEPGSKLISISIFEDLTSHYFKVIDNGKMIPDGLLDKIFEPGFSTKGEFGEGMGLYIVKEIISKNNGDIKVDSSEEETTFIITIPKCISSDDKQKSIL